jgi:DHA1 family tetracycline resistance protein-like MFS transporter
MLQGGIASLTSITSIVGPPFATNLFGYFISPEAPVYVPGASFFAGALLLVLSLVALRRIFQRVPAEGIAASSPVARAGP